MNLNFIKIKKGTAINPADLHKKIRSSYDFWLTSLYIFWAVVFVGVVIGGWQFYSIYTDRSGKTLEVSGGDHNILNIESINSAVQKREDFINTPFTASEDPS